jgi:hypothetical protein
MPKFVIQMSAAASEPFAPRLPRATETNASATARTQRVDGKRAAHSFRTPNTLNDAATSQFTSGGLVK